MTEAPVLVKLSVDQFIVKHIAKRMVLVVCTLDLKEYWISINLLNQLMTLQHHQEAFKLPDVYGAYIQTAKISPKTNKQINVIKALKI